MTVIEKRDSSGEADFWRIRQLILDTYPLVPIGFNREVRWWDGGRFHREDTNAFFEKPIQLWQTVSGELVGVALSEGDDGYFSLLLHPDYRQLEAEMMNWAETHLAILRPDPPQKIIATGVWAYDIPRCKLLQNLGYQKTGSGFAVRRRRLGQQMLPEIELAEGYRLRTSTEVDHERMADILNAGFGRTSHTALEYQNFATLSPSFRHDLNLVAEAANGKFAAHVGITFDEQNQIGIFEPVCTHPDHRRKGLAQALMIAGLHRLKALGANAAYVETGDALPANSLYDTLFEEVYLGYNWEKVVLV